MNDIFSSIIFGTKTSFVDIGGWAIFVLPLQWLWQHSPPRSEHFVKRVAPFERQDSNSPVFGCEI